MSETALAEVRNRRIGFVFQQFNLLASMTAWQNVELPLVYAGRAPGRAQGAGHGRRSAGSAWPAGCNHRPGELSGGQQQRVAVARALVTEPDLILADEPTGNLDSKSAADVLRLMDELHEAGRTLVLITHDVEVASAAGRVVGHPRRAADRERPAVPGERPVSWLETFRTGVNGVRSHRLRSFLTVLGILIGIAGVIITVGLGEGASGQVTSEINALGSNVLTITPGSSTSSTGHPRGARLGVDADHGRRRRRWPPRSTPPTSRRWPASPRPVRGPDRRERDGDDHGAGDDAVLADRAGPHAWPRVASSTTRTSRTTPPSPSWARRRPRSSSAGEDPVGQTVDVNGVPADRRRRAHLHRVASSSSSSTSDPDDTVIIPITTGAERIFGGTSRNSVSSIAVQARSSADLTGRLPGGGPPAAAAARDHQPDRRRLHHHLAGVADRRQHLGRPHADHPARRHRRHLADRRRHRRHEHHAGLGDRAHPRDRACARPWAPRPGSSGASSSSRPPSSASSAALLGVAGRAPRRALPPRPDRRPHLDQPDRRRRARWSSPWPSASSSASTRPAGPPPWPPSTPCAASEPMHSTRRTPDTKEKEEVRRCSHRPAGARSRRRWARVSSARAPPRSWPRRPSARPRGPPRTPANAPHRRQRQRGRPHAVEHGGPERRAPARPR